MEDYLVYKLMSQHLEIDELVSDLEHKELMVNINNKWSVFQHVAHLGRYQEIFKERLETILQGSSPFFDRYVSEKDTNFFKWCESETLANIEKLNKERTSLVNSVLTLPKSKLECLGEHPTFGKMPLIEWVKFFLYHESHHLYQIFRLKNQIKAIKV